MRMCVFHHTHTHTKVGNKTPDCAVSPPMERPFFLSWKFHRRHTTGGERVRIIFWLHSWSVIFFFSDKSLHSIRTSREITQSARKFFTNANLREKKKQNRKLHVRGNKSFTCPECWKLIEFFQRFNFFPGKEKKTSDLSERWYFSHRLL